MTVKMLLTCAVLLHKASTAFGLLLTETYSNLEDIVTINGVPMKNSVFGDNQRLGVSSQKDLRQSHTIACVSGCEHTVTNQDARQHPIHEAIDEMWAAVHDLEPVSDKFSDHTYQTMYGTFLWPLRSAPQPPKMLEIGLGCNMRYGPGASVQVWNLVLPGTELWEAEYDAACVDKARKSGQLNGTKTVTGDQGNAEVVQRWIRESGGNFDIIIDDGGHKNKQIKTSFDNLWPTLKPGGMYFIEDLQVGRNPEWDDSNGQAVMTDIIEAWIEQLLLSSPSHGIANTTKTSTLPKQVDFIFCQHEACVIGKSKRVWRGAEWKQD